MRIIKLLIGSSLGLFVAACISSVLTGLCSTMVIKSIHQAVQSNTLDLSSFLTEFLVFWGAYGTFSIVASYSVSRLTQSIIHNLRVTLTKKILSASFESIETNQSRLLPILTEDINVISYSIERLPGVTTGLATVIGILAYMIWYSPALSLATFVIFLLAFLFTQVTLPYVRKYADNARTYLNKIYKQFEGLVYGIKELTLNSLFHNSYLEKEIIPTSKIQNRYYLKQNVVSAITNRSTDMILLLGMGMLIVLIFNTGFISLESFGEYLMLVLFTLAPLSTASGFLSSVKRIEVALDHIEKAGVDLDAPSVVNQKLSPEKTAVPQPILTLKDVSHEYYHSEEDEHFELGPVNLSIEENDVVFIVGGNGSGKTTLAKIMVGLYKPRRGEILYKGEEITTATLADFRDRFAAYFVDSYLFDHLLHIANETLLQKGNELIELLELKKKVNIVDGRFSTRNLSEGQKKRMALLTTILEDKEIYLFDEWAANQDPHFKRIFYEEILSYLKAHGKTVLVISHDDQYYHCGDRIIKLADGQIVDVQGAPA